MVRLPVVSGRELARAREAFEFQLDRQRGSHMILRQDRAPYRRITVPDHREIAKGTLAAILRQAGITVPELRGML